MKHLPALLLLAFFLFLPPIAHASGLPATDDPEQAVQAELVSNQSAVTAGKQLRIGVRLRIAKDWHIYYKEPGDIGRATTLQWTLPDGMQVVEPLQWEQPVRFRDSGMTSYGYKDETVIATVITVPSSLPETGSVTVRVRLDWLVCKELCVPGGTDLELTLPVSSAAVLQNEAVFAKVGFTGEVKNIPDAGAAIPTIPDLGREEATTGSIAWYLLLALVGGMLLNLMPCVLPVLALKVFSLVHESGESARRRVHLGVAYTAGTIGTFLVLGIAVIAAQYTGMSIGWGFQFQQPLFLIGMCALLVVMSLSLFGLFFIQISTGQQELDKLANRGGLRGSFFKGVLATILSTPCTAPFFGAALGFAFAQSWWITLSIFSAAGLGMALPFLLLALNPTWRRFIPKPGAWMETFKQGMAFLLLGTAVWLLSVLGTVAGASAVSGSVAFLLSTALAAWLYSLIAPLGSSWKKRILAMAIALAIGGGSFMQFVHPALQAPSQLSQNALPSGWSKFSEHELANQLAAGNVVLIDFTAEWCLTCKVNEQTTLLSQSVRAELQSGKAVILQADWTNGDPEITRLLRKFGRSGVPLYVVFSPHRPDKPVVLPEVLTPDMVIQKLREAATP